jgi:hypothetical protein
LVLVGAPVNFTHGQPETVVQSTDRGRK